MCYCIRRIGDKNVILDKLKNIKLSIYDTISSENLLMPLYTLFRI